MNQWIRQWTLSREVAEHVVLVTLPMRLACRGQFRDDDFPFQKIAFSVWENSEFRFKGLSKWKFRLAIDTVHKNSVYKRHTNYESGYFQRVTWSVSHCDIACIEWFMCVAEQAGLISPVYMDRECLAWIARCDDSWTIARPVCLHCCVARSDPCMHACPGHSSLTRRRADSAVYR